MRLSTVLAVPPVSLAAAAAFANVAAGEAHVGRMSTPAEPQTGDSADNGCPKMCIETYFNCVNVRTRQTAVHSAASSSTHWLT